MADRRRIIISFKGTEEDIKLFDEINKHSDKSAYVKDYLKGIINSKKNTDAKAPVPEEKKDLSSEINDILGI